MSDKMTVGQIVNESARFARYRWSSVLRFALLPGLISALLFGAFTFAFLDSQALKSIQSGEAVFQFDSLFKVSIPIFILGGIILYAIVTFLFAGVYASIFRLVALGEERPGIFQLRIDGVAKRVFIAILVHSVIIFAVWVIAILIGGILTGQAPFGFWSSLAQLFGEAAAAEQNYQPSAELMQQMEATMAPLGSGILIAFIPLIYLSIKLFIFPAASAIENRLALFASVRLTFGHFWTMFGSIILMGVFTIIASLIYGIAAGILELIAQFFTSQGAALALAGGVIAMIALVAEIAFNILVYSVWLSMPAIMYRRLTTGE